MYSMVSYIWDCWDSEIHSDIHVVSWRKLKCVCNISILICTLLFFFFFKYFFGLFWLYLIEQLEELDRKQGKRRGVTRSKGTRAGSRTRVRCRASAHGSRATDWAMRRPVLCFLIETGLNRNHFMKLCSQCEGFNCANQYLIKYWTDTQ